MGEPAQQPATYADLQRAPKHLIAELVEGVLHTQPRPASPLARAIAALTTELGPPFDRGKGGPGGWVILYEPEVHLGTNVLVPDMAGWRRATMVVDSESTAKGTKLTIAFDSGERRVLLERFVQNSS